MARISTNILCCFKLIASKCEDLCFMTHKNICQCSKLDNFAFKIESEIYCLWYKTF